jgi:epoxyqueuosine reductase
VTSPARWNTCGAPQPRRTHPRDLLPEAHTVIVVAAGYYQGDHPADADAKIARYAWGEDYHHVLRSRLGDLARWIETEAVRRDYSEPLAWRAVTDSAPAG